MDAKDLKVESPDRKKERAARIVKLLKKRYPKDPKTALDYTTTLDLLVATILSAQCTDARVNIVTKELFRKYRTAKDYAGAGQEAFEQDIRPTGFFRNKAKNIIAMAQAVLKDHGGEVPSTMEELVKLPGVGRKTANLILSIVHGVPGIVCDTHVIRVSGRLGLVSSKDAEKVEAGLYGLIDKKDWIAFSNRTVMHGRDTCNAKKPDCASCVLKEECPSAFSFG